MSCSEDNHSSIVPPAKVSVMVVEVGAPGFDNGHTKDTMTWDHAMRREMLQRHTRMRKAAEQVAVLKSSL